MSKRSLKPLQHKALLDRQKINILNILNILNAQIVFLLAQTICYNKITHSNDSEVL